MTELVEKVARAIVIAMHKDLYGCDAIPDKDNEWLKYTPEATAAIEAMRLEIEREIAEWLRQPRVGMGYVGRCIADKIEAGEHRSKP
jgi:hypothetical protein